MGPMVEYATGCPSALVGEKQVFGTPPTASRVPFRHPYVFCAAAQFPLHDGCVPGGGANAGAISGTVLILIKAPAGATVFPPVAVAQAPFPEGLGRLDPGP